MNEQRIVVITDSGTDTPADFAAAHDVRVIPLRINYSDGSTYENGVDITAEEVVERFAEEIPESLVTHTRSREYNVRPTVMPSFAGAKPFGTPTWWRARWRTSPW